MLYNRIEVCHRLILSGENSIDDHVIRLNIVKVDDMFVCHNYLILGKWIKWSSSVSVAVVRSHPFGLPWSMNYRRRSPGSKTKLRPYCAVFLNDWKIGYCCFGFNVPDVYLRKSRTARLCRRDTINHRWYQQ